VLNDSALGADTAALLKAAFDEGRVTLIPASEPGWTASEDSSELVNAGMPQSLYFSIGGYEPEALARYKAEGKPVPVNHSPFFAPAPRPAIRTGVETLTLAVLSVAGLPSRGEKPR
jgi:hippurate hydrolase